MDCGSSVITIPRSKHQYVLELPAVDVSGHCDRPLAGDRTGQTVLRLANGLVRSDTRSHAVALAFTVSLLWYKYVNLTCILFACILILIEKNNNTTM